jgi:uncharacterized protein (DUF2147 family)
MPAIRSTSIIAGLGLTLLSLAPVQAAGDPTGVWLNDTGRGAIEIKPCGNGLCGHVVWVKDTSDSKGCGRQIIGEARQMGSGLWDGGWIYSPEKKKKYDVELKPLANGNLRVKGYAGTKLFSRTMIWKPAPADLVRCDASETIAKTETKTEPSPETKTVAPATKPVMPPAASNPEKVEEAGKDVAKAETTAGVESPAAGETTGPADSDADIAETEDAGSPEDGINMGKIAKRLADLERETGYGLKKTGNGDCRLNVPFATIRFKCDD